MVREHIPKLHNYLDYRRHERWAEHRMGARKFGSAVISITLFAGVYDMGYTLVSVPESAPVVTSHDKDIPGYCQQASMNVVYLDPTGKPVIHSLAEHNKPTVRAHNGASWSVRYGTRDDMGELGAKIREGLDECTPSDGRERPLILVGESLGGKIAQELDNIGVLPPVMAIIQEAAPAGPDYVGDPVDRFAVELSSTMPIVVGKGVIETMTFFGSFRRGVDPFHPIEQKNNKASVEETNPKVLSWQAIANARPYPSAKRLTDNTAKIFYIYSRDDEVVDTVRSLETIDERTLAEVIPLEISREHTSKTNLNHAEGWIDYRYGIYEPLYEFAFDAIATDIKNREIVMRGGAIVTSNTRPKRAA